MPEEALGTIGKESRAAVRGGEVWGSNSGDDALGSYVDCPGDA